MGYRYEVTSIAGFIQQLAVGYCAKGYRYYVVGKIPEGKDPREVCERLIRKYDIDLQGLKAPRAARFRRKKRGLSNLQLLLYGHTFVLIATPGIHLFFEREGKVIRTNESHPIKVFGYAVSFINGRVHVRISRTAFHRLKATFLKRALRLGKDDLELTFRRIPYQPYAPVRSQLFVIFRAVNRKRRERGLAELSRTCVPQYRRRVRPFKDLAA